MIAPLDPNTRLSAQEAASYLGDNVTARTLQNWRTAGLGPRFIKVKREIQYWVRDLNEYLASCENAA